MASNKDEWGLIMTNHGRLLASASVLAVVALGATPAFAAGTASGTTITNNVSVAFKVGGVDQTASTASNDFKVDRKIIFTVAEQGSATTSVVPGATGSVTTFVVTNTSNATLDFSLTPSQLSSGASGAHSNTDSYNVSNLAVYADVNGNGTYESGTDTRTFIDELAPDTSVRVFIIGDTALATADASVAAVRLTAVAREGGSGGSQGAAITEDTGANQEDAVDTVFADTGRDNSENALDDYTVSAATLSVVKTSTIISDPVNNTTNPKMIPGATVEYCITVANSGAATATNVTISDTLPANTTYVNNSIYVDGDASCANGSLGGSQAAGVVTAPLSNITGGSTSSARFRVTVN
jgi:uncharacterized repeat protein (TIGR01451 family)